MSPHPELTFVGEDDWFAACVTHYCQSATAATSLRLRVGQIEELMYAEENVEEETQVRAV